VFYSLDVGMPKNMWGLHAAMIVYFMTIVVHGVEDGKKKGSNSEAWKRFDALVFRWKAIFDKFA
jgi:hypothetical protein